MLDVLFTGFAATCRINYFLGIPPWYKYLVDSGRMVFNDASKACELVGNFKWQGGGDIVLIALGVLDIALRLAGLVAIGFVLFGAIQYITSDGSPDKTKDAQQTIINALVGLVIALIATTAVGFIGRTISH
jgi:hypothetical protein